MTILFGIVGLIIGLLIYAVSYCILENKGYVSIDKQWNNGGTGSTNIFDKYTICYSSFDNKYSG